MTQGQGSPSSNKTVIHTHTHTETHPETHTDTHKYTQRHTQTHKHPHRETYTDTQRDRHSKDDEELGQTFFRSLQSSKRFWLQLIF